MEIKSIKRNANFISMGKFRIWINPNQYNIDEVKSITHKYNYRMHIFITNGDCVNDNLKWFLANFFYDAEKMPSVTVHIPAALRDIKPVIEKFRNDLYGEDSFFLHPLRIRVFCEKNGVRFAIDNWKLDPQHFLHFRYGEKSMEITVDMGISEYDGYDAHFREFGGEPGAVKNKMNARFPEVFKDRIIADFKTATPPGILKTFKNDDEIWEYINQGKVVSVTTERRKDK